MDHIITEETERNHQDGNMTRHRMVCNCAWKGSWRYEYEDSMRTDLMRDEAFHRKYPNTNA